MPAKKELRQKILAGLCVLICGVSLSSCNEELQSSIQTDGEKSVAEFWPRLNGTITTDPAIEEKITNLISQMSLEQKIAQMIQPEIRDISVEDMRQYGFGSYLNGGGAFPNNDKHSTPSDWVNLAESMYQASIDDSLDGSSIPTMWGTDAVHGHNNVIGATLFPHNIGLGAANNPALIEKIARITATEVMATGIDWVFAPTVAVARDDRWGRAYESYSEDPEIVKSYAAAIVKGLQGEFGKDFLDANHVIATVKHFIGDGGTQDGDDQGNNIASEQELFEVHAQGYVGGLSAGAQTVMASFNSWQGSKIHGDAYLLTEVLKNRMGFDGLVVGDWNGHGQVSECTNQSCPQAVNAGLDIYMVPTDAWKALYENTIKQVNDGQISMARIDDAVSRILRVKLRAGLFDKASPAKRKLAGNVDLIGHEKHRQVARQAVRESLVLLKNSNRILPLLRNQRVLVAGTGAHSIGKQSGGWTITWQGTNNDNDDFPGATSIYDGIKQVVESSGGNAMLKIDGTIEEKPDVAIVVFGEEPYAEGNGDLDNLDYQRGNKTDLALLKRLKADNIPVVSVFISGRPLWVNPELNASDAFVAAWLPGTEGGGISDVLFRNANSEINFDFTGKLSFSWPSTPDQSTVNRFDKNYEPLFPYGYGLTYKDIDSLGDNLKEVGVQADKPTAELSLFQRTVRAPWQLYVSTANFHQAMKSNVINDSVKNSAKSVSVSVRTIDKKVQEDARQITWHSAQTASVSFRHAFPTDLRAYLESRSSMVIELKRDTAIKAPIILNMNCSDFCFNQQKAQIDITELVAKLPQASWQSISISLDCFARNNVDFSKVFIPFSISTSGPTTLSFSNISLKPNTSETATLQCN